MTEVVDLREEPESRLALAALSVLRDMDRSVEILTRGDPSFVLRSLNLQLRDSLAWESAPASGHWRTTVRLAPDTAPTGILDQLVREHRHMDALLGRALRCLNAGDLAAARTLIGEVAADLRRHVGNENDLLAPALGADPAFEPLRIMLHEHEELLLQLDAVEEALDGEAWELESYVAMLSGTLAKHEHREETGLFPAWAVRLAAMDDESRAALERAFRAAAPRR